MIISKQTLLFLQKSMYQAVKKGTVKKLNHLKNFEIYAKTGTAQTCSLKKKKKEKKDYEHAWLVSFFSYKKQRPLVLIILIENVGACLPAVQAAQKFFTHYEQLHNLKNIF